MQSFHVSVPVLNQPANFAAVITARTRIDKRKSAAAPAKNPTRRRTDVRRILLAKVSESFIGIDFDGSGPADSQTGGGGGRGECEKRRPS